MIYCLMYACWIWEFSFGVLFVEIQNLDARLVGGLRHRPLGRCKTHFFSSGPGNDQAIEKLLWPFEADALCYLLGQGTWSGFLFSSDRGLEKNCYRQLYQTLELISVFCSILRFPKPKSHLFWRLSLEHGWHARVGLALSLWAALRRRAYRRSKVENEELILLDWYH